MRLAVALVLLAGLALALRRWPSSWIVRGLRETVPLLACFLIYTNLHDTIGFVNPHDVHDRLVAMDRAILGIQPCVWAERLITPGRTELMQLLYLNFSWIAPSTSLLLLLRRRWPEFRAATVGTLTCFFIGYALYVAAGWVVAAVAVWLAPRLDAWWSRRQRALGYGPARGAP